MTLAGEKFDSMLSTISRRVTAFALEVAKTGTIDP